MPISTRLKQLGARALFRGLKALRVVKRWLIVAAPWVGAPLRTVGRFLFRHVFVRAYRLFLVERMALRHVLVASKNWVVFLMANRYVTHAAAVVLILGVSATSVFARDLQATEAANRTLLFAILTAGGDDAEEIIKDETPPIYRPAGVSYLGSGELRGAPHYDADDEPYAPVDYRTVAEGSAVLAPSLDGTARSVAPRDRLVEYVVQEGDTIGSIAVDYGLSVSTILWANNLGPRDYIHIGGKLKIPQIDGVLHTVKSGDTVEKIAKRYGAETDLILAANRLGAGTDLRIGDVLMVPGGEPPAPAAPRVAAPRPIAPLGSLFRPPSAPTNRSTRLLWPTPGRVITQYFGGWENVRGWRVHTGIDIDGDYKDPNYAAEDGIVIRAGWNTGYGNVIDIDHGGGMVTRYAHNSKLFVKVGQQVKRGEVIAMIGTTGFSTGTHLHFEVRINGRAVNPFGYLR